MTADGDIHDVDCGRIRELVVWYPTKALDAAERRLVEEHSARCAACADLLRLAADFKEVAVQNSEVHTDPAVLVSFVEDPVHLDAEVRQTVERHLSVCPDCREQAGILTQVDRTPASDELGVSAIAGGRPSLLSPRAGWRGFWDLLGDTLFRPIPAAIYMVLAIVATVLLVTKPGERVGVYDGRSRSSVGDRAFPGLLGGVVILGDESGRVRGVGDAGREETVVDRGQSRFLLLELTELESPPVAGDTYTVEFVAEESGGRSFAANVTGDAFRENYTLGLFLEEGTLPLGRYAVRVKDAQGEVVFRSSLSVR